MPRLAVVTLVLVYWWALAPSARDTQDRAPSGSTPPPIFRLSISLVQLDAVVTDSTGHHVTTLGPADFDVYQDGAHQAVTAVSYIEAEERWEDTSGLPPLPAAALRGDDARRALVIVVDDRRMSFESVYRTRLGLQQFIDRQFRSGDGAMLVTTSGRAGPDRRFTFNAVELKSAVRRLRHSPSGLRDNSPGLFGQPRTTFSFIGETLLETGVALDAIERVSAAVDALKDRAGRKLVILVSEGFSLYGGGLDDGPIRDGLQHLVDRSNRAGVVLYAIDPRGVVVAGLTAADNGSAESRHVTAAALRETQGDLRFVAAQTGGFAVINNNDLGSGFERIMADQRGYYLIGYQPAPGTVDESGRLFRRVEIRAKRKGLTVRTRAGFYGIATE